MARYRWMIAASSRITWKLGSWFPNAVPLIYVQGFPKSGTVWATQMVADYLQLPYPQLSIFPIGFPAVVHGHSPSSEKYRRNMYVLRDGRDVIVSLYFHLARRIPEGDQPSLSAAQKRLFPGLRNKGDVAANLPGFIENQMTDPHASFGLNWGQHVARWLELKEKQDAPALRFESLLEDPNRELAQGLEVLTGETTDPDRVAATVQKFSFKAQTGRKRGQESRSSFLRKGQAGDWVNHFSPEAAEVFHRHCGEALIASGYEPDDSWQHRISDEPSVQAEP